MVRIKTKQQPQKPPPQKPVHEQQKPKPTPKKK